MKNIISKTKNGLDKSVSKIKWFFEKKECGDKYCHYCRIFKTGKFLVIKNCKVLRYGGKGYWHYTANICKECYPQIYFKMMRSEDG